MINKETNRFYKDRLAIKKISDKTGKDVGVATSIYIKEKGLTNYEKELHDWQSLIRWYEMHSDLTLADLFK